TVGQIHWSDQFQGFYPHGHQVKGACSRQPAAPARVLVSLAGAAGCLGLGFPCWRCGLPGSWFPLLALRAAWTECLNLMPMGVKPLATIGRRSAAANTGRAWRDVSQNGNRPAALSRNERATGRKF